MSLIDDLRRFHNGIIRHSNSVESMQAKQRERSESFIAQIKDIQLKHEELWLKYEEAVRSSADLRRQRNDAKEACENFRLGRQRFKEQIDMERAYALEVLGLLLKNPYTGEEQVRAIHILEKFQKFGHEGNNGEANV